VARGVIGSVVLGLLVAQAGVAQGATRSRVVTKAYVVDYAKPTVPYAGVSTGKAGAACTYRGPGTQCLSVPTQSREGAVSVRVFEDSGAPVAFALLGDWDGNGSVTDREIIQFCGTGGIPIPIRSKPVQVNVSFGGKVPYEVTGKTACPSTVPQRGKVRLTFLR